MFAVTWEGRLPGATEDGTVSLCGDPEAGQLSLGQAPTLKNSTADAPHMAGLWGQEDAHQFLRLLVLVGREITRENPEQKSGGMGQPKGGSEVRSVLMSSAPCLLLSRIRIRVCDNWL